MSTIEKLVKFLEGEDDSQGFLLNLAVSTLSVCDSLRNVGDWTFAAISIAVEWNCSKTNF